ncbi:thioesterase domain-containing protein [Streptomyces sp. NBC_01210]|uniref:thioesterase II family protein n=1 Tax=Streptomyces sp. NBC_01210 TaxID=2903774 RepID=UPI002E1353FE|nr:thioesterase domain-containing protein [Streptomyces sp. NBC_01210]
MSNECADLDLICIRHASISSKFRLAGFPHSVESTSSFLCLAELLLPTVEMLMFQHSYAYDSSAPPRIGDLSDLAGDAFETLAEWTDRPLALFGHGRGAHLAYRVARRLERETGTIPATLFVSGAAGAERAEISDSGPELRCPIVALTGETDRRTPVSAVRNWRHRTSGTFDLEVFPGARGYLDISRRQVANLVHDQLLVSENKGA